MSKEQQELLEIAYMDYTNKFKPASHTPEPLSLMEFVTHIKNDERFAKAWGIKIEERELSLKERQSICNKIFFYQDIYWHNMVDIDIIEYLKSNNIPTKLITITYNNIKSESYE